MAGITKTQLKHCSQNSTKNSINTDNTCGQHTHHFHFLPIIAFIASLIKHRITRESVGLLKSHGLWDEHHLLIRIDSLYSAMRSASYVKTAYFIIQALIGVVLVAYIAAYKFEIDEIVSVIAKTEITYFVLAALSYFTLDLILSYRLFYLLQQIGHRIEYHWVLVSHLGGMLIGDVTPGRSGYLLTPVFLKRIAEVRASDAVACIFAPQGLEFLLKVGGALAAIVYLISKVDITYLTNVTLWSAIVPAIILLLLVGGLMLGVAWLDERYTERLFGRIPLIGRFIEHFLSFKDSSIRIRKNIKMIVVLYMAGWVVSGLQWYLIGEAMNLPITYLEFFLLHPLITMLMFVPITPAGLGIMEYGTTIALSLLGISQTTGIAFALLVRANMVLTDALGITAFVYPSKKT